LGCSAYADSRNPNGNDWNSWKLDNKVGYVHGYIDGSNGVFLGIFETGEIPSQKLGKYLFTDMTIRQIIDGLDTFYYDFKNRSIPVVLGIYVVKKQIKGASQDDIEKILIWLRSGGLGETRDRYLSVRDLQGNIIRTIDFP
jgi:hypothetical protein